MRAWYLVMAWPLMLACGPGVRLGVSVDGAAPQDLLAVRLDSVRRFGDPQPVTVTISNSGRQGTDLIYEVGSNVMIVGERPQFIGAGSSVELPVSIDPDAGPSAAVSTTIHVLTDPLDEPAASIEVMGERTAYIQFPVGRSTILVDQAVDDEVASQGLVGAAVAVIEGQDIVFLRGVGLADRDAEVSVDPSKHRFRWASLSKGLTAAVAMSAVEEELLDLDAPISDYVTDYEVPAAYLPEDCDSTECAQPLEDEDRVVTMRLLLSHTAGIQHYSNGLADPVPADELINDPAVNTGMHWALERWTDAPLIGIPGESYSYSTFGYNLAGVGVERAVEESLGDRVQRTVNPIIEATTLQPDRHWDPAPDRVVGYYRRDGVIYEGGDDDVSWKLAGGGFESTVEDLARYCAGLMGDELVDPTLRDEQMWTRQPNAGNYGLGFGLSTVEGERIVAHTGSQQSTRTALWIDRDQDRCFVTMSNSTWADPSAINAVMREAWDR